MSAKHLPRWRAELHPLAKDHSSWLINGLHLAGVGPKILSGVYSCSLLPTNSPLGLRAHPRATGGAYIPAG